VTTGTEGDGEGKNRIKRRKGILVGEREEKGTGKNKGWIEGKIGKWGKLFRSESRMEKLVWSDEILRKECD
jgi:hypothetical protein